VKRTWNEHLTGGKQVLNISQMCGSSQTRICLRIGVSRVEVVARNDFGGRGCGEMALGSQARLGDERKVLALMEGPRHTSLLWEIIHMLVSC
jgi:hypothetical protein